MKTLYFIELAVWYVVFAVAVIRLHLLLWPQRPGFFNRAGCTLYLFLTWWFVFPFMVSQLHKFMKEDDDE